MRLFLMMWMIALAGCGRGGEAGSRAVDGVDLQELWAAGYDGTLVRWGL